MSGWRRTFALGGLVALALLHVSAAVHEYQHDADHDVGVCQTCSAYSNLENAAVPHPPSLEVPVTPASLADNFRLVPAPAVQVGTYRPRAPPLC